MNSINEMWRHTGENPFKNFDAFHCMDEEEAACDFCPHCGIDERCEISGHFSRNSIWFSCWWCRWVPKANKNYELCKGVVL